MPNPYVPECGDIVWLDFNPVLGHEQGGRRPALVLSPSSYDGKTGLMICCPMTTKKKGYPFEVVLSENPDSVVLSDQITTVDWTQRHCDFKGRITTNQLADVRDNISLLISLPN